MSRSTTKRLSPFTWVGQPLLIALAAVLVFAMPARVFRLPLPEPVFPMALAFAWALIRPSVAAPVALLVAGLFLDLTWGGRLGLWTLVLALAYGVALALRRTAVGRGPAYIGGLYLIVSGTALAFGWILTSLLSGAAPSLMGLLGQFVPTALLYPAAYVLIARFEDADVRFR